MPCARCGGLLIEDRGDLAEAFGPGTLHGSRCVNCGAMYDPVILANRRQPEQSRHARVTETKGGQSVLTGQW